MSAHGWTIDSEPRTGGLLITDDRGGVATVTQRDPHPVKGNGVTWDQCAERARLIAAAPELLEALKQVVYWRAKRAANGSDLILPPEFQEEEIRLAMAAIAKATGGAA
jgi:hypothetical protein